MDFYTIHTVWTLIAFVMFIGIVVWAWSGKRKEEFEYMSRVPLDDDRPLDSSNLAEGK